MNRLIWLFLIVTRLRDRLRCPNCKAVGTYKLHAPGPGYPQGVPWRWLCKWCGWYRDEDKSGLLCYPSSSKKCWVFYLDKHEENLIVSEFYTMKPRPPAEVLEVYNELAYSNVWPWRG